MRSDRIDPEALQRAVQARVDSGELTFADIARALDYTLPDTVRVKRRLGLRKQRHNHHPAAFNKTVDYDFALKVAEVAGLDPIDIGA
jgi:hypothetical protein